MIEEGRLTQRDQLSLEKGKKMQMEGRLPKRMGIHGNYPGSSYSLEGKNGRDSDTVSALRRKKQETEEASYDGFHTHIKTVKKS